MHHKKKSSMFSLPTNDKEVASEGAMVQVIGVNCLREVYAPVPLVAIGAGKTEKREYNILERVI